MPCKTRHFFKKIDKDLSCKKKRLVYNDNKGLLFSILFEWINFYENKIITIIYSFFGWCFILELDGPAQYLSCS